MRGAHPRATLHLTVAWHADNGFSWGGAGARLKILLKAFTLTFVAEWGDRSQVSCERRAAALRPLMSNCAVRASAQIATIAMAAASNPIGVTVGGILGHAACTGLACVGGKLLAARISERTVHLAGGALFLLFGVHSLLTGP
jgi:putative Ca2+/H+ antiporter (TMEM165/GDT1 family)